VCYQCATDARYIGAIEIGTKRPAITELFVRYLNQGRLMALRLDEARD